MGYLAERWPLSGVQLAQFPYTLWWVAFVKYTQPPTTLGCLFVALVHCLGYHYSSSASPSTNKANRPQRLRANKRTARTAFGQSVLQFRLSPGVLANLCGILVGAGHIGSNGLVCWFPRLSLFKSVVWTLKCSQDNDRFHHFHFDYSPVEHRTSRELTSWFFSLLGCYSSIFRNSTMFLAKKFAEFFKYQSLTCSVPNHIVSIFV